MQTIHVTEKFGNFFDRKIVALTWPIRILPVVDQFQLATEVYIVPLIKKLNMKEPNREEVEKLLKSVHDSDVPNWTSKQKLDTYTFLKQLYSLWYRREL